MDYKINIIVEELQSLNQVFLQFVNDTKPAIGDFKEQYNHGHLVYFQKKLNSLIAELDNIKR